MPVSEAEKKAEPTIKIKTIGQKVSPNYARRPSVKPYINKVCISNLF
jgi:hypothetical protein